MADRELLASWTRTTAILERARELLGDEREPGIDEFENYIAHNELGLAFDVLVEVGASQRARRVFWEVILEAAGEMKLAPDGDQHAPALRTLQEFLDKEDLYPCPCCGFLVFDEGPGSYAICPVCGWEDDLAQLRFPTMSGANPPLITCQATFLKTQGGNRFSATLGDSGYLRDPRWRPLNLLPDQVERPEPGIDQGKLLGGPHQLLLLAPLGRAGHLAPGRPSNSSLGPPGTRILPVFKGGRRAR